jgi:hypothetical protein
MTMTTSTRAAERRHVYASSVKMQKQQKQRQLLRPQWLRSLQQGWRVGVSSWKSKRSKQLMRQWV